MENSFTNKIYKEKLMKNTMKKALSLLVAFALVCVPMIASAAVGDGVAMPSDCIYSGDYVTVGAGETVYFEIGTGMTAGTYGFTVEGEGDFDVAVCTEGNGEYPYAEGEAVSAVDGVAETEITSFESTYNYAAFAITNNSENEVDYLVTILFPEGTQDNPKAVTLAVGTPVEVTIAAGVTYYIGASLPMMNTEYNLTVTGAPGFYYGGGMMRPSPDNNGTYTATVSASMFTGGMANFNISNGTEEEQTYTLTLENMPAGASEGNPEVIEENGDYVTSFADGHFYQFTAIEAGTITVTMTAEDGWQYNISGIRADETYYYGDTHWSDDDPVVASESVAVSEGDVFTIWVSPYATAETTVAWSFSFEAGAGEDPIDPPAAEEHVITVSHVNYYTYGMYKAMVVTGEGTNCNDVANSGGCQWWLAIKVDNVDDVYTVVGIEANGDVKEMTCSSDGFILYIYCTDTENFEAGSLVEIDDVLLDCDFDWTTPTASETAIGSMTFGPAVESDDPITPPENAVYDENGPVFYLDEGTADYIVNPSYTYTLYGFEPSKEGNYTITADSALIGIVSYNGMWVTIEPSADVVNMSTIEWECTSVGQSIWVAVLAEGESVSITVEYEEVIVIEIPEYDYENVVTPEEFVYNGDTANFDYVETFDDIVDNAVLGDDGYYHLNSADGPVLFVCLNDALMSLVGANTYGQLTYVEYDEDGNVVSKTHYATAFEEYAACAYTDESGAMYYPLTVDLMVMFQNVGEYNGWYGEYGFVGGDLEDAWMFACYYDVDVTTIEPAPEYDPNGDGAFNMFDYIFVKATVLSNDASEEEIAAADVNGDGKLNMFDYIAVKSAYFAI
jgi:hypothetical protein